MKKLIALILAVILLSACTCAFAENAVLELAGSDSTSSDGNNPKDDFDGELIKNGGFADGMAEWDFFAYESGISSVSIEKDDVHGNCLHISASDNDDARAKQTITVYPECYYEISALVKTENVTGGNGANLSIDGIPDAHSECLYNNNDWQLITFCVETGNNMTSIVVDLRIGGYSAEASGDVWFDDVKAVFMTQAPTDCIPLGTNTSSPTKNNDRSGLFAALAVAMAGTLAAVIIIFVIYAVIRKKKASPAVSDNSGASKAKEYRTLIAPSDTKMKLKKAEWIFIIALIIIYGATSLIHLGTTQAPETEWVASGSSEPAVIKFDGQQNVSEIYVFGSILGELDEDGTITVLSGDTELTSYTEKYGDMFRWKKIYDSSDGWDCDSVTIRPNDKKVAFREIAVFDKDGNKLNLTVNDSAKELCDEQNMIPDEFSGFTGMYFDELYHGRTAYEHLHNLKSYENSHPPLGKLLISVGIALFGMNSFGWRVVGALFGVAMLPVFYLICKRIFKDRIYFSMTATTLFAFDFMHFVQTRIATIDVYGVFFILLMFYFMYWYLTMSFYRDGLMKTLLPLGLCGLAFGLGAASKWICMYAGAGLALMLLISFVQRITEYNRFNNSSVPEYKAAVKNCWKNIILTCLFCVAVFIIIPVIIYALSYLGYPDVKEAFTLSQQAGKGIFGSVGAYLDKVWGYQEFMYNYHSGLTSTHPYQSTWVQWIFDLRPIWYSIGYFPDNHVTTISAFGNPIVWWLSLFGTAGFFVQLFRKKIKMDSTAIMIIVGIGANLLPWVVFVKRCVFIYHYFATVPFIILAAMFFLKSLEDDHAWTAYIKWLWAGLALVLFAVFYPVLAGTLIPESYALNLEWFKSWWFVRNANAPTNRGVIIGVVSILVMIALFIVIGLICKKKYKKPLPKKSGDKTDNTSGTIEI